MGRLAKITRRTLLIGSVAIAGGVAFGYWKYRSPYDNPLLDDLADGESALTPYLRIDRQGITIITPRAEMGQGVQTTLAALVAEELGLPWEQVGVEHGPASHAYYNSAVLVEGVPFAATDHSWTAEKVRAFTRVPGKLLGMQVTGGSSSIADAYVKMRQAGATARYALIAAAAQHWSVDSGTLSVRGGAVVNVNGDAIPYTQLAAAAADIDLPDDIELKPREDWQLLGRSLQRLDMAAKCDGSAEFAIDVQLPGMRYAAIRKNPQLGARLQSYDASAAESMPGVDKVIAFDDGVAAIAGNTWQAFRAVDAVDCNWEDATYPASSDAMLAALEAAFTDEHEDSQFRDDGDVETALVEADVVEAEYRVPYLAHATMEPMTATAWLQNDKLEIWAGNQLPTQVKKDGAELAGLDEDRVFVHTTFMGGGFGRRAELDFIKQAIEIAMAVPGTPVKLTWTREEDTRHDYYRPAAIARLKAAVANGTVTAIDLKLATSSVVESQMGRLGVPIAGPDLSIVQSAWDQPYDIENYRVTGYRAPEMLPVSSWRSVGASQNGFFHESALDEVAHAAGADPMQMRIDLCNHVPSRQVLQAVAAMSDWGAAMPENRARGVAFVLSFGVPVAEVVEVEMTAAGIRVVEVFAAADVGIALDPRNIEAQIESGILFGLSAAMYGEISVQDGQVRQSNFHDYPVVRMREAPRISVRILENGDEIRGIGEPGLPPLAPALANAIFALTGQRVRELPLSKHLRFS